ncbi:hypothetical protein [Ramlibacter sp. WS9]|uniref:hypothetical protein n=1 Tax=Ramlibacter sp. WS9 TaxID=1882741 RepID=UPI0018EE7B7D|nr:hypothetical protein [Ramlibacter sp. WS9]
MPMKVVYRLADELASDPKQVALAQQLTLDASRPYMGLKGTHGLFGSEEWWKSVERGLIQKWRVSGIIRRAFVAGQDPEEPINAVDIQLESGEMVTEGIYATDSRDQALFAVGHQMDIVYVLDELKAPVRGDGRSHADIPLEVSVSSEPVEQPRVRDRLARWLPTLRRGSR